MDSKLTGMWVTFFTAAGIPSEVSATYALTFTENRIQNDMLLDLNKEYLKDMGIVRMGDVIAILRHAKQVHEHAARDKVLSSAGAGSAGGAGGGAGGKVPVAAVTGRTTVSQPSSPASRILEHYTRNPAVPESPSASLTVKRKSNEMISPQESQVKKRQIRFENKLEVKEGGNKTVFARLGNNEATIAKVVTNHKVVANQPAKPIYARLGSKAADAPQHQIIPIPKDALKYEGILKSPPTPAPKNVTITTTKHSRKIFTMRADETPVSVKDKLALPKAKSVKFSSHIQYKEIEKVNNNKPKPKATQIFNKPERRLTMPEGSTTVKSRLGLKTVNNLTITKNVFNRLGEV